MRTRFPFWSSLALLGCESTAPITQPVQAPVDDYYAPRTDLLYEDHVYVPTVRTVQLFRKGFEVGPPVIELGSSDQLELHFDDLQGDARSLSYTIVHCDAQWRSSDLVQNLYIDGAFPISCPHHARASVPGRSISTMRSTSRTPSCSQGSAATTC